MKVLPAGKPELSKILACELGEGQNVASHASPVAKCFPISVFFLFIQLYFFPGPLSMKSESKHTKVYKKTTYF